MRSNQLNPAVHFSLLLLASFLPTIVPYICPKVVATPEDIDHKLPLNSAQNVYRNWVNTHFRYKLALYDHCTVGVLGDNDTKVCAAYATVDSGTSTTFEGGADCKGRFYCPQVEAYSTEPKCKSISENLFTCCFITVAVTQRDVQAIWNETLLRLKEAKLSKETLGYEFDYDQDRTVAPAESGSKNKGGAKPEVIIPVLAAVALLLIAAIILILVCCFRGKGENKLSILSVTSTFTAKSKEKNAGTPNDKEQTSNEERELSLIPVEDVTQQSITICPAAVPKSHMTMPGTSHSSIKLPPTRGNTPTDMSKCNTVFVADQSGVDSTRDDMVTALEGHESQSTTPTTKP